MKLSIGKRILIGFGLLILSALILGGYSLYTMAELRKYESTIAERDMHVLELMREIAYTQGVLRGARERAVAQALMHKQKLLEHDARAVQSQWRQGAERTETLLTTLQTNTAEYEKNIVAGGLRRKEQWSKIRQNAKEMFTAWKEVGIEVELLFDHLNKGDMNDLKSHIASVNVARSSYDAKVAAGVELTTEQIQIGNSMAASTYESAKMSIIVGLVLMLMFGIVCTWFIQRSIAGPLTAFMGFVKRVGQGDLTQQATASTVSDLDQLSQSLNGMVDGLKEVAAQSIGVTQNLNAAAAQIMASIQEQGASTKEQAATIQQITTTMEEISQSGAQISGKAKQVAAAAEATSSASNSGIQAVQETSRTMASIRDQVEEVAQNIVALSEKTQAVGEIIATVNDLAERSNLLALNAAIEAAAAGDQGNRFSVVANEMKNLADQAKDSTIQVRTILGDIQKGINSSVMLTEEAVKRVETGKQQSDITEQTIRQMARTTIDSITAFEQIIGAGNQQQIGVEQVAQGMKDIRQAVGQTAAATTQMEKAAANLNELGAELKRAVGRYKL